MGLWGFVWVLQDLFWSKVFWGFSYKAVLLSFPVFERGSHLILRS